MELTQILFFILAGLTLLSALMVITSKNPIYSILYLIITFFSISGHYIMLNAQFLAVVNIIVYAGAVMVLFLFVVMLMNLNAETKSFASPKILLVATIIAGIFLLLTIKIVNSLQVNDYAQIINGNSGLVENLGKRLYKDYVLPFELSSILFISAMLGAVMLSKKDKKKESDKEIA